MKDEITKVKDVAVKLVTVIAAETAIAEEKLAAAKPALDAAEAALQVRIARDSFNYKTHVEKVIEKGVQFYNQDF